MSPETRNLGPVEEWSTDCIAGLGISKGMFLSMGVASTEGLFPFSGVARSRWRCLLAERISYF